MLKKHISSFLPIGNRPITDLFDPISDGKLAVSGRKGGMKTAKGKFVTQLHNRQKLCDTHHCFHRSLRSTHQ